MAIEDTQKDMLVISRDSPDLAHIVWHVYCPVEMILEVYEDCIIESYPEIGLENENNNRNAPRLPLPYRYSFFYEPVITTLGHKFYDSYFGENGYLDGMMGSGRDLEFIGKRKSMYIFRFIKMNALKGCYVDFHFSYYLQRHKDIVI